MPDRTTSTPGAAAPSQLTAQKVIEMFAELGLPVCDDGGLIKQKFDAKRDVYLRHLRNPQPSIREKAELGVKNGEAMQSRRPELLRAVYQHFAGLADTAISAALASGVNKFTAEVLENLRRIARDSCKVDDALSSRFLADYMRERGLEQEKELVSPGVVEQFRADSGRGWIALKWTLPAERCDEVEITREQEPAAGQKKKKEKAKSIYRGRDAAFTDQDVTPGGRYTYRARVVFQKVKGPEAVARAVCIGEVQAAAARWKDGRAVLSWQQPGPHVSVVIFRREGGPPSVRAGARGPEPASADTAQVYRGSGETWADGSVTEGVNYHYRIVADFGDGLFSQGVDVQAAVPKAPPPVPSLRAACRHDAGRSVVLLEWEPVSSNVPIEYVLVRREGSAPPARADQGTVVQTTAQTRSLDESIAAGRRYTYAVFARAGDLLSRSGTAAPPVDVLAEVSDLSAQTGHGTVELHWRTPPNVGAVVIRRSLAPPRDHTDGVLVPLAGAGHAKDEGLRDGQRYHYLVCCAYRPDGATEIFSPGVRAAAVPEPLPDPVGDFGVRAEGAEVLCRWTPPRHGLAVVVRSAAPHGLAVGHRLRADEINNLGLRVAANESGGARDVRPDPDQPYYSVFTIAGSHAVAGGSASVVVCPDVSELKLSATRDGAILRWAWPQGCTAVRVVRRAEGWPAGPDDPQATSIAVMKTDYTAAGDKFVDRIQHSRGRFHYVVYAQAAGAPGLFFSSGTSADCRAVLQWEPWMTLRYRLLPARVEGRAGPSLRLVWSAEQPFPNFSGFTLVAGAQGAPASPDEGVELFRWTPGGGPADGEHEETVSLEPVRQRRWARFYCNVFVLDPAQRHSALVVHPNTSIPFSETGEQETRRPAGATRVYRAVVPKTVVCPRCFDEFPTGQMLFTSFGDDAEAVPGRFGLLDRLLKRPPQPPTNKQGQRLARKLCPACRQELPFTAGAQESMIIGLIGAKSSGKSHYVASLVKRVQEQVCHDLQAALIPMSDETQQRYQTEFYEPLFGNGLELPLTVGAPPPLVYDLTLSGRLWNEERNRAVTLTLYDTAGENFDRAETVRQMVKYLRVASGIIFLIDPLQVPAVRESLPSGVPLPDVDRMAGPEVIIGRVLQELEHGRVVTGEGLLDTPIAVVLTKCDVLRDAGLIAENRLWNTDARHVGYFDTEANEDMIGMMGNYVRRWSPAAYNTVVRRFARHAFFGVSATGCAPDKRTHRYRFISPWRIEDPLLWLLAEMGVIPKR